MKPEAHAKTAYSQSQATSYDQKRFENKAGVRSHKMERAHLFKALELIPLQGSVLEVGCGTGRLLLECAEKGYTATGADASPNMIEQFEAKIANSSHNLQLHTAEAARLPFPDNCFDLTYAIRLLNQTESPDYALRTISEMIRITEKDGYILAECVNSLRPRIGRNSNTTTRLSAYDMIQAAEKSGAKLVLVSGSFFLGMGTINAVPAPLLPMVAAIDEVLARIAPKLCSRVYVLLRKGDIDAPNG